MTTRCTRNLTLEARHPLYPEFAPMMEEHRSEDIACSQLETAIRLYDDENLYAALTLAGAAEEVLGKLVQRERERAECETGQPGPPSALYSLIEGARALSPFLSPDDPIPAAKEIATIANRARNALKHHLTADGEVLKFDARDEAASMINRALSNHWSLYHHFSPVMETWDRAQRRVEPVLDADDYLGPPPGEAE